MAILKILFITILFPCMITTSSNTKTAKYALQGTVANRETGKPLADVYLYTVKGEEEAITNGKGEFKFVTWKKLPVTIHIHKENEEVRVVVTNPSEFIKIKL